MEPTDDSDVSLVLIASPLLGPAVWASTAVALRARGWAVSLPSAYPAITTPEDVLEHLLGEIPTGRPIVLVPHSNAGLYVAALAAARTAVATVFTDALLPLDAATTPADRSQFREFLATLAGEGGVLPPWTQWWSPAEMDAAFPDAATRAVVEQEERRLPLSYFDDAVPSPPGWESLPTAYLAFGDAYTGERADVAARGGPVRTLAGGHLLPLTRPDDVAGALESLLGQLGLQGPLSPR